MTPMTFQRGSSWLTFLLESEGRVQAGREGKEKEGPGVAPERDAPLARSLHLPGLFLQSQAGKPPGVAWARSGGWEPWLWTGQGPPAFRLMVIDLVSLERRPYSLSRWWGGLAPRPRRPEQQHLLGTAFPSGDLAEGWPVECASPERPAGPQEQGQPPPPVAWLCPPVSEGPPTHTPSPSPVRHYCSCPEDPGIWGSHDAVTLSPGLPVHPARGPSPHGRPVVTPRPLRSRLVPPARGLWRDPQTVPST